MPVGLLTARDRSEQVQLHETLGQPRRGLRRVHGWRASGVVDEHVEASVHGHHGIDHRERGFALAQIHGQELPVRRKIVDRLASADRHRCAGVGESLGDAPAHTFGATRDEDHLACEVDGEGHAETVASALESDAPSDSR